MATAEKAAKKTNKFMLWYTSYKGKVVVNCVYSIGASVVIIGALFKILHWPGASYVLMAGMFTEAFLFIIGCLEFPHPEYHWHNVFPQLVEYGTEPELLAECESKPAPTLLGAGSSNGVAPAAAAAAPSSAAHANAPQLSDKDLENLKNGINDLAKTATQLSELGKLATSTTKLGEKLESASEAADKFSGAAEKLGNGASNLVASYDKMGAEMDQAVAGTKALQQHLATADAKLGSINAVYELQLNTLQAQAEAQKQQNAALESINGHLKAAEAAAAEAKKEQETYATASKQLAKQVTDLNAIYGNMLTALA